MRRFLIKLLKNGLPTAALLAVFGYVVAQFAGMWYVSETGGRESPVGAQEIAAALRWRLPLMMALWGFGLVALFEGVLALWSKPPAPAEPVVTPVDETEQLLLQILEAAEAAEAERQERMALAQTPAPPGLPARKPVEPSLSARRV